MTKEKYRLRLTFNVPNILSLFRLSLTPFFVLALSQGRYEVTLGIFAIAAITDTLDGLAARLWGMKTPLGKFLDPMADKILMTAAFISLSLDLHCAEYVIPTGLTILVISRDIIIVMVAFLIHVVTGRRNFDPTIWGKIATTLQASTIFAVLLAHIASFMPPLLDYFYLATLLFTLISGFHYLFLTVHLLNVEEEG